MTTTGTWPASTSNGCCRSDYMEKFLKTKNLTRTSSAICRWTNRFSPTTSSPDSLKYYLGKKAVGRLGCFGCHDIPGLDSAKPIGTGLMDWGKKKSDKLAFEDVARYIAKTLHDRANLEG